MKLNKILFGIGFGVCTLIGIWSIIALISGAVSVGGIVPLITHWMSAVGLIGPAYTMVDFYTRIKGIEYIICAAFFVIFPLFYKYVNKETSLIESKR